MTETVLVTGGAGYVGSHVSRELRRSGYAVVALDDLSTGFRELARDAELIVGDIADAALVRSLVTGRRIATVVHCAARASVPESVRDPELYRRINVEKAGVFLREAAESGVRRFIFSSSCAVYGVPSEVPIPEDHPIRPTHPYGETKAAFEEMLAHSGLAHLRLRYFNAAGADAEGGIGERHEPESHLIPNILAAAHEGRAVPVFGTDYPTPDGTCVRDYVHVTDLGRAHVMAIEYLCRGGKSGALNLGTGTGRSVREVVEAARSVTGREIRLEPAPRRPGDPPALVAKQGRAVELGWTHPNSDLETILRTAWAWFQASRV